MFGSPYLRLLRHEIEALVAGKYGGSHLKTKQLKDELAQVNRELKKLKAQTVSLEKRKAELTELLAGGADAR